MLSICYSPDSVSNGKPRTARSTWEYGEHGRGLRENRTRPVGEARITKGPPGKPDLLNTNSKGPILILIYIGLETLTWRAMVEILDAQYQDRVG